MKVHTEQIRGRRRSGARRVAHIERLRNAGTAIAENWRKRSIIGHISTKIKAGNPIGKCPRKGTERKGLSLSIKETRSMLRKEPQVQWES